MSRKLLRSRGRGRVVSPPPRASKESTGMTHPLHHVLFCLRELFPWDSKEIQESRLPTMYLPNCADYIA